MRWVAAFLAAVDRCPGSIVVSDSLGFTVVANAVKGRPRLEVHATLLVSPGDVDWIVHIGILSAILHQCRSGALQVCSRHISFV